MTLQIYTFISIISERAPLEMTYISMSMSPKALIYLRGELRGSKATEGGLGGPGVPLYMYTGGVHEPALGPLPGAQGAEPPEALEF